MKHEELTHKIIGCAYQVYNQLGFGFLESVYKKAMILELAKNSIRAEEEKPIKHTLLMQKSRMQQIRGVRG